ncbi:MAG: GMC family oxidoreductase [Xenococcaceae cyanobacterium MO_188.B19]|nr:GMC family oxidoreductase [Xenococcaceae cyanobacterium MO_188.B19]
MPFNNNYVNLVTEKSQAHTRLIRDYDGSKKDFDFIIIGSGIGGGILADDLADRLKAQRILVLDAGSFIYPTHVYNICRIPNFEVARHFGVDNFNRAASESNYIGENPQLAFGGRSVFWSGLIPDIQDWELEFFPDNIRNELKTEYLKLAGGRMNQSISLGKKAKDLVEYFRSTDLSNDFVIEETPRALHQPYLDSDGTPSDRFYTEPTGVFNTAELLINQVGLTPGAKQDEKGLFIKLNSFVEAVNDTPLGWHEVMVTDTITEEQSSFYAPKVIIAAGSIESPKLINRSAVYQNMSNSVKKLVGFGLTDHPVTGESQAYVSALGGIALSREDHAKIIFYSKGNRDGDGHVTFPFNIEMNINHEYWHLRNNDPSAEQPIDNQSKTRIDLKFSFANCLDDENGILSRFDDGYVPEIRFKRFSLLNDLLNSRFPALAGWRKSEQDFFNLLNGTRDRIFNKFDDLERLPDNHDYGRGNNKQLPFGWGTVHHACGTLRMPWKSDRNSNFNQDSVVDENLKVKGSAGLYVCDMSVMPISTAANPVRTLAGLALRLSKHLG